MGFTSIWKNTNVHVRYYRMGNETFNVNIVCGLRAVLHNLYIAERRALPGHNVVPMCIVHPADLLAD